MNIENGYYHMDNSEDSIGCPRLCIYAMGHGRCNPVLLLRHNENKTRDEEQKAINGAGKRT